MRRLRWLPLLALLAVIACQQAVPTVSPSITSFAASPSTVRSGEASTLSWSVTGATTLSIAPAVSLPSVGWFGPTTTTGALHALQWRVGPGGLPTAFVGHGQRPLALQAGSAPYTGQDMALLPISSSSLSGIVGVPAGVTLWQRALFVVFPEGGLLGTAGETTSSASFIYVTPVVAGATMTVAASGVGASLAETSFVVRAGLLPGATNVALPLPAVPRLVAPGPGATGVGHGTSFAWASPAGGVAVVTFSPHAAGPTLTVVTAAESAVLPNLAGLGLALPASADYAWSVVALPGFATVDAAAADEVGLLGSWVYGTFAAWRRDGAMATSLARDFTMAP